jgi:hypothetical protein
VVCGGGGEVQAVVVDVVLLHALGLFDEMTRRKRKDGKATEL